MIKGTKDNIFDLIKYIEEQKLQYVLSVWNPNEKNKTEEVTFYTSLKKDGIKKLHKILGELIANENNDKI